jgi:hypothetical protein
MLRDSVGFKCKVEEQPRNRNKNDNERHLMLLRRFRFGVGNVKFVILQKILFAVVLGRNGREP